MKIVVPCLDVIMIAFSPRNIQWSSLFARKARVNTERVPPGHPIILLKSNEFNMAAVSVKRSIPLAPKQKMSMKIEVWKLEPLCYSLDSHVATLYSSFLWWVLFRAFHKLLEILKKFPVISQKVAQKLHKKQSKVAFCNESCSLLGFGSFFTGNS